MVDVWDWKTAPDTGIPPAASPTSPVGEEVNPYDAELVSIVIPVYNTSYPLFHYTGNCIGSVREHTDKIVTPYEIILVDNGSPINLPNLSDYKTDKVVKNDKNMGVAYAWNQGIRVSRGGYICLLNNDTMVFDHWLEDLKECLEHVDLIMATPMYGETYARAVESAERRKKWEGKPLNESFSDFRDFACVMFKKSTLDEVGIFDEEFGLGYGEDLDLFDRLDRAGKRYASTKKVNIFHVIGATSSSIPDISVIMDKNRELLAKKKKEREALPKLKVKPIQENKPEVWGGELPTPGPVIYTIDNLPALARTVETGDPVFLIKEKTAYWVQSPEVLQKLGYGFGDVVTLPGSLFAELKRGETIDLHNVSDYAKSGA